jgi:NitT/TauT family transport system substrate-binding protein
MRDLLLAIGASSLMLAACSPPQAAAPTSPPAAATSASKPALKNMTVQLSFLANVQYYGISYAAKTGIFERNGLNVEYRPGGAGIDPIRMASAGAVDIGLGDPTALLVATANSGVSVTVFAADFQRSPISVMCRGDRGVTTLADIKGKTVGIKPNADPQFQTVLLRNNLKKEDITYLPIGLTDVTPIIAGNIDCQFTAFSVNEPYTLKKNGITPVVFLIADNGIPTQGDVYFTDPQKIKDDPAKYAAFVKSVQESWRTFIKDPPAAAKWVVDNRLVDGLDIDQQTAQANAMIELLQPPGMTKPLLSLDLDTWKATAKAAKDAGTVTSVLDVATLLSLDTVTQASK